MNTRRRWEPPGMLTVVYKISFFQISTCLFKSAHRKASHALARPESSPPGMFTPREARPDMELPRCSCHIHVRCRVCWGRNRLTQTLGASVTATRLSSDASASELCAPHLWGDSSGVPQISAERAGRWLTTQQGSDGPVSLSILSRPLLRYWLLSSYTF